MAEPILIAVVGHTNAGKTSLLRTLTRHAAFGDVSERPGTTRHVEAIDLKVEGAAAVRFFDTPGLEDAVALADYMKALGAELARVVDDLEFQRRERQAAGCRIIAELLVSLAALRQPISQEDFAAAHRRERFIREFRETVLRSSRNAIDDLMAMYGFRSEDADGAVLPWLDGRWEDDLFNPETLRDAGRKLGTGATVGGAIGLAADIALAGLALGAGTALGAAIGGLASQGWGQFGRRLANKVRGVQELTLENEVLFVLARQMLDLLVALEQRGHAAQGKIAASGGSEGEAGAELKLLLGGLQAARGHPEWASAGRRGLANDGRRMQVVETAGRQLTKMFEPRIG